jgi:5-oxoprolinase (ATP-hydrolysing)/N-methylhydantoinase A
MLWPTSASNGSVEVLETRAPVLLLEKAYVADSGGAGHHRGGLGQRVRVRRRIADGGRTLVNSYPEGIGFTGHALFGGLPGGGAHTIMLDANGALQKDYGEGAVETLTALDEIIEIRVGGGAGYGHPLERSIDAVQGDLDGGYISQSAAEDVYGCVLHGSTIDAAASARKREMLLCRQDEVGGSMTGMNRN